MEDYKSETNHVNDNNNDDNNNDDNDNNDDKNDKNNNGKDENDDHNSNENDNDDEYNENINNENNDDGHVDDDDNSSVNNCDNVDDDNNDRLKVDLVDHPLHFEVLLPVFSRRIGQNNNLMPPTSEAKMPHLQSMRPLFQFFSSGFRIRKNVVSYLTGPV
ncbi:GATA zinc finger domain-containing protein 15-like [Acropora millepora]|uniref:GATA zinc finger domain-containing protein 15-like n=1 Tax=Acropora millepora TaxID=45264 RepID=UPI001CF3A739|nr:GATA zinc finger domain-containing protein 15-like [Acropora millepora]